MDIDKALDAMTNFIKTFSEIVFDNQKNQLLKLRDDVELCQDENEKEHLKELLVKQESDFKQLEKSYDIIKKHLN